MGIFIDLMRILSTICSTRKEKDSTYSEVIHIVVQKGAQAPGHLKGQVCARCVVGALKTPGEADFGSVIEHGVARTKVGKVWARHREALVTDIEVESGLNGVSETGGELPSKVPLVRRVGTDFGQGGS